MLVKVIFKNGKVRELSEHIANDAIHQRSLGFKLLEGEEPEIKPIAKKKNEVLKSHVAEVNEQVETVSIPDKIIEEVVTTIKKRGRPARN